MTFIETISAADASEELSRLYEADRSPSGSVPNYTQAFSLRPGVYAAWQALNAEIKASMDLRRYELATLAAALRLRSSYCALAHGSVLLNRFLERDALRAIVADHRTAGLDAVDAAVMHLADKVADDATTVTQADVDHLRSLGLADAEIFDVIAAASARCFFSTMLDGLGAEPDARYGELEPELRSALTVGRPIGETRSAD
jgi:uncharacterized peroxidase-related enzyme